MNTHRHLSPEVSREAADRMARMLWQDGDDGQDGGGRAPLLLVLLLWLPTWLPFSRATAGLTWCLSWWGAWGSNPEPTD
jgi:hypothetical protein